VSAVLGAVFGMLLEGHQFFVIGAEFLRRSCLIAVQVGVTGLGLWAAMTAQQLYFDARRRFPAQVVTAADTQPIQHGADTQGVDQALLAAALTMQEYQGATTTDRAGTQNDGQYHQPQEQDHRGDASEGFE
jgi:hypothetical protein